MNNLMNKILIERPSRFESGNKKLVINASIQKVYEIKILNLLRKKFEKNPNLKKFEKLLTEGFTNNFFSKAFLNKIYQEINLKFSDWDYDNAIQYYQVYLNSLSKNNQSEIIKGLDFLFFPIDHGMAEKNFDEIRKMYIKLFENYLLLKMSFDNGWKTSRDSLGFTLKEHIISQAQYSDEKTAELLMKAYNKNVHKKDEGYIETDIVNKMIDMIYSGNKGH